MIDYNVAENILGKGLAEVTPAETATSTDNRDQISFCDVSASASSKQEAPSTSKHS
ncbi:hypothetical protein [Methanonatronarchaeum sp. AMET6-2]|uniref:hypothetical protein n=1 Tax=Methanonatronarchaeum sp. AMET6-2 TaxID=2933293 RepID=UPI001FF3659B|nr:hypothetical protein [Methanonatronarchaeum sp. AMET6-2]UOY09708.1 hypothetical protein MU439_05475 [Methanonatronarchaeum sp. AMET6-2]